MKKWQDIFTDIDIFYITPDVKRGIGIEDELSGYHIVCTHDDPLVPVLRHQGAKIFCLEETIGGKSDDFNNSGSLLAHPEVSEYISRNSVSKPCILVFKPSLKVESVCRQNRYMLLANPKDINDYFEDKINFFQITSEYLSQHAVPGETGILGKLDFSSLSLKYQIPLVVQFSHGWAGKTTYLISNSLDFQNLKERYIQTRVKINRYIRSFTVLNNACVCSDKIYISPPALQVNDIALLEEKPNITCGRQWPVKVLTFDQIKSIRQITEKVGKMMRKKNYRGYFGLDFMIEEHNGKVYLSENNARFTASSSFYTKLELGCGTIPLMVRHMAGFMNREFPMDEADENLHGSQIIFREKAKQPKSLSKTEYGVFKLSNGFRGPIRKNYYPQSLIKDEFIFIRRKLRNIASDLEISRIECLREVLKTPSELADWMSNLMTG